MTHVNLLRCFSVSCKMKRHWRQRRTSWLYCITLTSSLRFKHTYILLEVEDRWCIFFHFIRWMNAWSDCKWLEDKGNAEVAYCSLRYACTSFARLIKSGKGFAGVSWSIVNFFAVVGRFFVYSKMAVTIRILQSNYTVVARFRVFSYFRYCNNYCRHCGAYTVCVCVCVWLCASVASILVQIVSGGKKSEMDADYAAILTN